MTQMIENDLYVLVAILLKSLRRSESPREKIIMQEFILSEPQKHPDWRVQGPNLAWRLPNSKKRPGAGNISHCQQTVTRSSDRFSKMISTPVQHSWVCLCANLIHWISWVCFSPCDDGGHVWQRDDWTQTQQQGLVAHWSAPWIHISMQRSDYIQLHRNNKTSSACGSEKSLMLLSAWVHRNKSKNNLHMWNNQNSCLRGDAEI